MTLLLLSDVTVDTNKNPSRHPPRLLITLGRSLCYQQCSHHLALRGSRPIHPFWTVLDFKNVSLCLQVVPISLFNWENPEKKGQLIWTQLPSGVKSFTTVSAEALAKDLAAPPSSVLVPQERKKLRNISNTTIFLYVF